MKKLGLLVIPLMTLSLFSCGNRTNDSIVNEQEMHDALTLKGVKYLQLASKINAVGENAVNTAQCEMSPNVFHGIRANAEETYYENFVEFNEGNPIKMCFRKSKDDDYKYSEDIDEGDYLTIEKFKEGPLKGLSNLNYNDFTYQASTKEYNYSFVEPHYSIECDGVIIFYKKRIKSFAFWLKDKSRDEANTFNLEYKKITPVFPKIPTLSK